MVSYGWVIVIPEEGLKLRICNAPFDVNTMGERLDLSYCANELTWTELVFECIQ